MAAALLTFQHKQDTPAAIWVINHYLHNYPIVDVMVNEEGKLQKIIPKDIKVIDENTCEIHFSTPRTGQARLV